MFPRKGVVDQYDIDQERKEAMEGLEKLIGKIEKNQVERKQFYELAHIINLNSKNGSPNSSFMTAARQMLLGKNNSSMDYEENLLKPSGI